MDSPPSDNYMFHCATIIEFAQDLQEASTDHPKILVQLFRFVKMNFCQYDD